MLDVASASCYNGGTIKEEYDELFRRTKTTNQQRDHDEGKPKVDDELDAMLVM